MTFAGTFNTSPRIVPDGITWGDATNDFGYDSDYIVDSVRFQDLNAVSPVPEPSAFAMLGVGLAGLAFAARRRSCRAS